MVHLINSFTCLQLDIEMSNGVQSSPVQIPFIERFNTLRTLIRRSGILWEVIINNAVVMNFDFKSE
jgi:hypothetical protein